MTLPADDPKREQDLAPHPRLSFPEKPPDKIDGYPDAVSRWATPLHRGLNDFFCESTSASNLPRIPRTVTPHEVPPMRRKTRNGHVPMAGFLPYLLRLHLTTSITASTNRPIPEQVNIMIAM